MIRWRGFVWRMTLLCGAVLAVVLAKDVLVRQWIVFRTQQVTGAAVEIGHIQSDLSRGELRVFNLQLADPHNPMSNLLQADEAILVLDPQQLLRRRIVIENGYIRNLQVDTPRTQSGELRAVKSSERPAIAWLPDGFKQQLAQLGEKFLDCVEVRQSISAPDELSVSRVASDLKQSIAESFLPVLHRARQLSNQLSLIAQQINTPAGNPLREIERVQQIAAQLPELERELQASNASVRRIKSRYAEELIQLDRARQTDLAACKCRVSVAELEPELLSSFLVSSRQMDQVDETLQWVRWLRQSVPDAANEFAALATRGVNVRYSPELLPGFAIESLKFDGAAIVGGHAQQTFGSISNWTYPPGSGAGPAALEVRVQATTHRLINAQFDYRDGSRVEQIHITQPESLARGQILGAEGILAVDVGPGREIVDVDLEICDDTVSGTIRFRLAGTSIQLAQLHELVGGKEMMSWLNCELNAIRQFDTVLHLSGSIDDIQVRCHSDLGQKIAEAAARSAGVAISNQTSQHQTRIESAYRDALADLNATLAQQADGLASQIHRDLNNLHTLSQMAAGEATDESIRR